MKVLILGATGAVGRHLVEQGLSRGHQLTALARHAEKLQPSRLTVVPGNVLDPAAVEQAVAGQEAVIYAVGVSSPRRTTLFSDSTRILIDAMRRREVRRLVCITGVGAGDTKGHGGFLYDQLAYPLITRHIYADKERQEALIRESGLDWVIVRPTVFREGQARSPFRAVTDVTGVVLRRIARAEVAQFTLEQLTDNRFLHQTPFIGHEN